MWTGSAAPICCEPPTRIAHLRRSYYGYLAAKAGIHVIDVSRISGNIAKVMQLCKARPNLTVPQAFREALRPSPRG
jgi:hypothetical protein